MLKLKTLLLLAATCCCVNAYCENDTLAVINKFWGKKPTRVFPKDLAGTITLLYTTACKVDREAKCAQTQLNWDQTAVDINEYYNTTTYSDPYYYVSERPGTITLTSIGDPDDDFIYIVYFNPRSRVAAYYQCSPLDVDDEPNVNLIAINYNQRDKDTGRAVKAALDVLNKLGIDNTVAVNTTCTSFNRKSI